MELLIIIAIAYVVSAAFYGFRMTLKYFTIFEGTIRNGTIITNAIGAGLIWPITLVLDGVRGVWEEVGPVKAIQPVINEGFIPQPTYDPSLDDLRTNAVLENLQ